MKTALETISTVPTGTLGVTRSGPDEQQGYTWTVSFLEDYPATHAGDRNEFVFDDSASTGEFNTGGAATVTVAEARAGTDKEVQEIVVTGGGDLASWFTIGFGVDSLGNSVDSPTQLAVLPSAGSCDGTVRETQRITTSTVDTTATGGDDTVSTETTFTLSYGSETTGPISAHDQGTGLCDVQAAAIETELEKLNAFFDVTVVTNPSPHATPNADHSCVWDVTFDTVSGDMALLEVTVSLGNASNGPATSATTADDTVAVSGVDDGNVDAIKATLESLSTVGTVTVTSAISGSDCTWTVTFDSNSGALPLIRITAVDDNGGSGDTVAGVAAGATGTATQVTPSSSVGLSGEFTLEFEGQRTGYISYDATAAEVEAALDALTTIGDVAVTR
jgi:hypothetical protein